MLEFGIVDSSNDKNSLYVFLLLTLFLDTDQLEDATSVLNGIVCENG